MTPGTPFGVALGGGAGSKIKFLTTASKLSWFCKEKDFLSIYGHGGHLV